MKRTQFCRPVTATTAAGVMLAALSACSAGSSGPGDAQPVDGKTLTIALSADPGSLDPQRSLNEPNMMMAVFAYDTPVTLLDSGQVAPQVLTAWEPGDKSYKLTVRPGVTCADGTPLDAATVAGNINYVADPENGSPLTGTKVPQGAVATADPVAGTVTVSLTADAPFFMQNLAELPLVCAKSLHDRGSLTKAGNGSGPYVLTDAAPGDHYDFALRKDYAWGPNGAGTNVKGMPEKLTFKVLTSPTTTANLLLNGQVNIAQLTGSDAARLKSAGMFSAGSLLIGQEIAFNEAPGEVGADLAVRRALIAGLNLADLAKVDSGGVGQAANGLIADPKICAGDTMRGNAPAHDPAAAMAALDQAGWTVGAGGIRSKGGTRLALSLVFPNEEPTTAATAEYIAAQWKKLGVDVKLVEQSFDQTSAIVFGRGDWGATLIGLGVSNPETLVPFFSGPAPDKGNNFGQVDNPRYTASVAQARTRVGTDGCADWNAAESALINNADITPISHKPHLFWGSHSTFDVVAHWLVPTSLRATN